jgi:hypothetical protein
MTDTLFKMVSFEKNILILVVLLPFGFSAFAQREKIDSLKKVLPSLSGNGRVDCLNALTETYLKLNKPDLPLPSGNGGHCCYLCKRGARRSAGIKLYPWHCRIIVPPG